jgi:Cd2+/Zn2+-exporting ATPase
LGSVDKVIFDKTGTLTHGNFTVRHLEKIGNDVERKKMLELLALIEAPSSHPLAATLVKAAKIEGVSIPKDVELSQHTVLKGEGVTATVDGQRLFVGNRLLFERIGMYDNLPQNYQELCEKWGQDGGTVGFLGVENKGIIAFYCVDDVVREEAKDVISSLQDGGIEVIMLTGDSDSAAKAIARQVGLPESSVHSQLLPEDKLRYVGNLVKPLRKHFGLCRPKSLVLMCGDGVNDAPALAAADVGVAMGEGAALAMEMSDITLMDSNLNKLLYAMKMGTRVVHTIQENIMLSLLSKLIVVGLTFAGKMTLLAAIASDVCIMLLVTLNGMKLLPGHTSGPTDMLLARTGRSRYEKLVQRSFHGPSNIAEIV